MLLSAAIGLGILGHPLTARSSAMTTIHNLVTAHLNITTRRSNQLHSAPERGRRHAMKSPHIIGFALAALLACAAPSSGTESMGAPAQPSSLSDTVPLYTNLG